MWELACVSPLRKSNLLGIELSISRGSALGVAYSLPGSGTFTVSLMSLAVVCCRCGYGSVGAHYTRQGCERAGLEYPQAGRPAPRPTLSTADVSHVTGGAGAVHQGAAPPEPRRASLA